MHYDILNVINTYTHIPYSKFSSIYTKELITNQEPHGSFVIDGYWLDINVKCKYFISYPKWAIIQIPKIDKYIFDLLPSKKCQLYNTNLTTLGNGIKHRDQAYCLTWIRRRHGDKLNTFDSFSFFKQYIQLFQQHMWWKIQKCHYCQLWKINTTVLYIS